MKANGAQYCMGLSIAADINHADCGCQHIDHEKRPGLPEGEKCQITWLDIESLEEAVTGNVWDYIIFMFDHFVLCPSLSRCAIIILKLFKPFCPSCHAAVVWSCDIGILRVIYRVIYCECKDTYYWYCIGNIRFERASYQFSVHCLVARFVVKSCFNALLFRTFCFSKTFCLSFVTVD